MLWNTINCWYLTTVPAEIHFTNNVPTKHELQQNQYLILQNAVWPGPGSVCGGFCTTGLQDKLVRTMAAIISSISTDSGLRKLKSNTQRRLWAFVVMATPATPAPGVAPSPVRSVASGRHAAEVRGGAHVLQRSGEVTPAWRLGPVMMAERLLSLDAARGVQLQVAEGRGDNVKTCQVYLCGTFQRQGRSKWFYTIKNIIQSLIVKKKKSTLHFFKWSH